MRSVYRKNWLEMVKQHSAKLARKNGGGAIYAWLYQHDKDWLITTNRQFKQSSAMHIERINWHTRDLSITRQLIKIRKQHQLDIDAPRGSRNWYLSKLGQVSSVEKNLHKLPAASLFFKKYCESVTDYQIRRITLAASILKEQATLTHSWRILRKAGLSKERITALAKNHLNTLDASECRT